MLVDNLTSIIQTQDNIWRCTLKNGSIGKKFLVNLPNYHTGFQIKKCYVGGALDIKNQE